MNCKSAVDPEWGMNKLLAYVVTWKSQGNYHDWKMSLSKGYILYDFIYVIFLK